MSVLGAGCRITAPYQTEPKSKNVDMALGLGPLFSQTVFRLKYLELCLGAGGEKAATDQSEPKARNVDMAPAMDPCFSKMLSELKILGLAWGLVADMCLGNCLF